MQLLRNLITAAIAGICMGLAPDPYSCWILAWVGLVPLWILTQKLKIRGAIAMGATWGFFYHGMSLFWITGIHPMTWIDGVSWWNSLAIAAAVWLIITAWGMVMSGLWAGGMAWFTPKLNVTGRVIVGCALLCALETIWSWGPLYWTALGYTQSPHDLLLLQVSRLSGQQTLTAAIVAVNGLWAEAWLQRQRISAKNSYRQTFVLKARGMIAWRYAIAAGVMLAAMMVYGLWEMNPERVAAENGRAIKSGIIQGNIPNTLKYKGTLIAVNNYTNGYEQLVKEGVEMVVTPETAVPFLYPDPDSRRAIFDRSVANHRVFTWLGAFGHSRKPNPENAYDYTNSLFLIDGSGKIFSQFDKVRLVPIGEYIPFKAILGGLIQRLSPLRGEVEAGATDQLVDTPWGRFTVGICYESAYPAHFRYQTAAGGQLILTASNNAHFTEVMTAQHYAQDVARAVESDRWAVRATNTGYSAFIDPNGRTIWISGINTFEHHAETVYLRQTQTLYVQWGDWLTPLLCLIGVGTTIWQTGAWHAWRHR
ncbi:apolipoprotein N-acyltransferase [Tumidithrix elongata RA019]|uniref:Apolipoprotein N-acyltransferase n=1 Tax=Tumidithrix elongata BACA0141 TaxID=2716417 RepID=A0AAW9PZC1_9CYAN|nr:apolipoprotein N-acyltransferase [Tumidithrix elongata RA019]